jgi:hypothetical protein
MDEKNPHAGLGGSFIVHPDGRVEPNHEDEAMKSRTEQRERERDTPPAAPAAKKSKGVTDHA